MPAIHDHYEVLGVEPTATLEQIRAAYRRRSKECHPDMGGSHDAMVELIAAWDVLRDAGRRATYDRARARPDDEAAHRSWVDVEREARATAQSYPRTWDAFLRWRDAVTRDFAAARYGTSGSSPTIANSASGALFIMAGAALCFGICLAVFESYRLLLEGLLQGSLPRIGDRPLKHLYAIVAMIFGPFVAGAWAGRWVHQVVRSLLVADAVRRGVQESVVVHCQVCGQGLRVPRLHTKMTARCPKCPRKLVLDLSGPEPRETCPKCGKVAGWDGARCTGCRHSVLG